MLFKFKLLGKPAAHSPHFVAEAACVVLQAHDYKYNKSIVRSNGAQVAITNLCYCVDRSGMGNDLT
jgi:hypothetical protein